LTCFTNIGTKTAKFSGTRETLPGEVQNALSKDYSIVAVWRVMRGIWLARLVISIESARKVY
jgi:hypothetical protein